MRSQLQWFAAGAAIAAVATTLTLNTVEDPIRAAPGTTTNYGEIARQLERIDRRLAALEASNVASGPAGTTGATGTTPAAAQVKLAAPEELRARERGGEIVNRAIASGTWNQESLAEFRAASGAMRGDDRFALLLQLAAAINQDRVTMEPGSEPR